MAKLKPGLCSLKDFVAYVWSFYGTGEIHSDYFYNDLTLKEVQAACALRYQSPVYSGESIDREAVRDILTYARNINVKDNFLSLFSITLNEPPNPRWSTHDAP